MQPESAKFLRDILDYATPPPSSSDARSVLAFPALVAIAFAAAVLWRAEVEWHGWGGLHWISYFHWAIPIGALLYLLWVAFFCSLKLKPDRVVLIAVLAGLCLLLYKPILWSLQWHYIQGPSALVLMLSPIPFILLHFAVLIVYPAIPCLVWLITCLFHVRISNGRFLVSFLVWLSAVPLACMALAITDHKGGSDSIHAIKSGFVIPPLVIALGLLFCPFGRGEQGTMK